MPTYTVTHSALDLDPEQRSRIANGITEAHNKITGANKYFAQVIFNEKSVGDHFMGGKLISEPQLFLHGEIRSGRTEAVKKQLILELRDVLVRFSGLDQSNVWVYIVDLLPNQMIEYGEVLPESGKENEWFANLSLELKEKLARLDK
ncbi:MAG: tautomerase family protein [Gammaproteobacteria bacterium]|nr:tautomerase family protein [Gammaproteobacteria bacterium]